MSGNTTPQTVYTVGQLAEYLKASLDADPALADALLHNSCMFPTHVQAKEKMIRPRK